MKPCTLLLVSSLAVLAGGCVSDYSPSSPDYYPPGSPPFTQNALPGIYPHPTASPPSALPALAEVSGPRQ